MSRIIETGHYCPISKDQKCVKTGENVLHCGDCDQAKKKIRDEMPFVLNPGDPFVIIGNEKRTTLFLIDEETRKIVIRVKAGKVSYYY